MRLREKINILIEIISQQGQVYQRKSLGTELLKNGFVSCVLFKKW